MTLQMTHGVPAVAVLNAVETAVLTALCYVKAIAEISALEAVRQIVLEPVELFVLIELVDMLAQDKHGRTVQIAADKIVVLDFVMHHAELLEVAVLVMAVLIPARDPAQETVTMVALWHAKILVREPVVVDSVQLSVQAGAALLVQVIPAEVTVAMAVLLIVL